MSYPTNLTPAEIAAVRASNLPRLMAVIETVQNAINTQPRKKP
jgi:hypothetical protein